jgi:hypothetical protein
LIGPCPFPSVNLAGFPTDVGHRVDLAEQPETPGAVAERLMADALLKALNPNER